MEKQPSYKIIRNSRLILLSKIDTINSSYVEIERLSGSYISQAFLPGESLWEWRIQKNVSEPLHNPLGPDLVVQ